VCGIVTISGKAVKLPYDDDLELFFGTVPNHSLKRGTVICLCGERSVDVRLDDLNIVFRGESLAFTKLTINALLSLVIGRISCIDYTSHSSSPLLQSL
jgi:hypothetical protein